LKREDTEAVIAVEVITMKISSETNSAKVLPFTVDKCGQQTFVRLIDALGEGGERISLRQQQRLGRAAAPDNGFLAVNEGVIAIDVFPTKEHRQIVDFLMPGDIITTASWLARTGVSVRAISNASLICFNQEAIDARVEDFEKWRLFLAQSQAQLTRSNVHQLVIGHLDAECRVASFILAMALRTTSVSSTGVLLDLPMSRDDIADHLAMNHDTLSRIMMRFETRGLIERLNRHAIRIKDLEVFSRLTPIAAFLSSTLNRAIRLVDMLGDSAMNPKLAPLPPRDGEPRHGSKFG
jgi:CRP-like cAMP-binding protein